MQISNATIDCWLWAGRQQAADYSDYQHHHWTLSPSQTIDGKIQKRAYTSKIDSNGHDTNGTWSLSHGMVSSVYQVWIPNSVILKQTQGYGVNQVQSGGSNPHAVSEVIWPSLSWDPNFPTPGAITFSDGTPPGTLVVHYIVNGRLVSESVNFPGSGGEDYTNAAQFWQKPEAVRAKAWWQYTINLSS